jgi:hypothetical protein
MDGNGNSRRYNGWVRRNADLVAVAVLVLAFSAQGSAPGAGEPLERMIWSAPDVRNWVLSLPEIADFGCLSPRVLPIDARGAAAQAADAARADAAREAAEARRQVMEAERAAREELRRSAEQMRQDLWRSEGEARRSLEEARQKIRGIKGLVRL